MLPKPKIKYLTQALKTIRQDFFDGTGGRLSWFLIFKLAAKNLLYGKMRTLVTVGAIAIGAGAIVFLVSFGYGLEGIVTNRLVQPNSLLLADVQSNSTALALTPESASVIKKMSGVKDFRVSVSLAGSLSLNNSRMDVVVIGTDNKFLEYSHYAPIDGGIFSKQAEAPFSGSCSVPACKSELEELIGMVEKGQVAGAIDELPDHAMGEAVDPAGVKLRFRVDEDVYIPVRSSPEADGQIMGYTRGELFESFEGREVWGSPYESVETAGRSVQDKNGDWWGRWIKTKVPLWNRVVDGVWEPAEDETGSPKTGEGFVSENNIKILSLQEVVSERQINDLIKKEEGSILGIATGSGQEMTVMDDSQASEAGALKAMISSRAESRTATASVQLGIIEVKKKGGKELIVSTGFLKTLKLSPPDIIGKKVTLEYIVSGGAIQGVAGRIVSKPVEYQVVGVVKEDGKSFVFAPLSDIESMGVKKYSLGKVLAAKDQDLSKVRERIEKLGFVTSSIVDTLTQVNRLFTVMRFLLGVFGMIAFIVAIFGMFNTLTVSLLERTREIAVMKTLGTTDTDVVRLFMVESFILGIIGGIAGIELGKGLGQLVANAFLLFQSDKTVILFKTPLSFTLLIFLLSTVVGLITGIFPSQRAKRINALDALRYE